MKKLDFGLVAIGLAIVSLALNLIALSTISVQQSTIRDLKADVLGLTAFAEAATLNDRLTLTSITQINENVDDLWASQDQQMGLLEDMVQSDVTTMEIINRLAARDAQ